MATAARKPAFGFHWALLFAWLFVGSVGRAEDEFPASLVRFRQSPQEPVFRAAGVGHWDVKIRERGWILRDSEGWHLWFTGYDGTREGQKMLGYAHSKDGVQWEARKQPVYSEEWVEDMMVVPVEGTYYMFAEGRNDRAQLLTSRNRIDWTRRGTLDIRMSNGMPIEDGPYGTPTAWYEKGEWWLFYERRDAGVWLAKATSKDLLQWRNVQDEPVLVPGPQEFDRKLIALNQIVKVGDRYFAYFHGSAGDRMPALWAPGVAVSSDLVHWKKYSGNPLRPIAENRSSGVLVPDGGQFLFFTMHGQVDRFVPEPVR